MSRTATFFLLVVAPALAILLALLGVETVRANPLGWFLLLLGIAYASGVVIAYYIHRERFWESRVCGATTEEEISDRSFWLITFALMTVFYLSPLEYLDVVRRCVIGFFRFGAIYLGTARLKEELFWAHIGEDRASFGARRPLSHRPSSSICRLSLHGPGDQPGIFELGWADLGSCAVAAQPGLSDKGGRKIANRAFWGYLPSVHA